jgi:hypothetical protein
MKSREREKGWGRRRGRGEVITERRSERRYKTRQLARVDF